MPVPISRPATSPCRRADIDRSSRTPVLKIAPQVLDSSPTPREGKGTPPPTHRLLGISSCGAGEGERFAGGASWRKGRQGALAAASAEVVERPGRSDADANEPSVDLPALQFARRPLRDPSSRTLPADPSPRHALPVGAPTTTDRARHQSSRRSLPNSLIPSPPARGGANGSQGERPGGMVVEGRWRPRPRRPVSHRASPTRTPTRRKIVSQPSSSSAVPSETLPPGRSRQTPHSPPCRRADIADPTTLTPPVRPVRQPPRH